MTHAAKNCPQTEPAWGQYSEDLIRFSDLAKQRQGRNKPHLRQPPESATRA